MLHYMYVLLPSWATLTYVSGCFKDVHGRIWYTRHIAFVKTHVTIIIIIMQGDALRPVTFVLTHITMHSNARIDLDSVLAFFCDEWSRFSHFESSM